MSDVQTICLTVVVCWLSTLAVILKVAQWHDSTDVTVVKKVKVKGK
jgi:hypothetical protein